MKNLLRLIAALGILLTGAGCPRRGAVDPAQEPGLAGAWRGRVEFKSGLLADVRDLEFMYSFAVGGTMTESSNYDGAPPVPPAYGIWRRSGPRNFEARYEFFVTKPPAGFEELAKGGGWLPAGRGILTERIELAPDGKKFNSSIRLELLDPADKPVQGGGEGRVEAQRIDF